MDAHDRIRGRAKRATASEARHMLELLNSLGGTLFRQLLSQKASELYLTYAQSQVLFRLAEAPGSHMGDVAKAFGVTLPAVTHIVDRLEEKGLVVRGDHPADRRVYLLDLTRAGKTLVDELEAIRLRGMERVLTRMAAAERRQVLTGLAAPGGAAAGGAADEGGRGRAGGRGALRQGPEDQEVMVRRLTGITGWALASALLFAGCSDNAAGKARVQAPPVPVMVSDALEKTLPVPL